MADQWAAIASSDGGFPGWSVHFSRTYQRPFYLHRATGAKSWKPPTAPPGSFDGSGGAMEVDIVEQTIEGDTWCRLLHRWLPARYLLIHPVSTLIRLVWDAHMTELHHSRQQYSPSDPAKHALAAHATVPPTMSADTLAIVLDTNVLLTHLPALQQLVTSSQRVILVVPDVVFSELVGRGSKMVAFAS